MHANDLFKLALGLSSPWFVSDCDFHEEAHRMDIHIDFLSGGTFACPKCHRPACKAHDSDIKTWRHLNFFQHTAFLHARVPRIDCPRCGIRRVSLPWARPGSRFSLLFEAILLVLVQQMPVRAVARIMNLQDTCIWRIVKHYTNKGRTSLDLSRVSHIGIDETASRRGQTYVTIVADQVERRVLFVAPGRKGETVQAFAEDLEAHGGRAEAIREVSCDLSAAYRSGIQKHLPNASVSIDRFHIAKLIGDAVDQVRREESKERKELVKTKQIWLRNQGTLTQEQALKLEALTQEGMNLKTAEAWRMKVNFRHIYDLPWRQAGSEFRKWIRVAKKSGIEPMIRVAETLQKHAKGILRTIRSGISNGFLEAINSLVQAAKARARGYRSYENFATMIYLIAGKLPLPACPL